MITIICPSLDDKRLYRIDTLRAGDVHRAVEVLSQASGKGANAARALACFGVRSALVAPAGDTLRRHLLEELAPLRVQLDLVRTVAPTRSCITVLEADGRATELVQEALPLEFEEAQTLLRRALVALDHATAVLLTGSLPPGCTGELYALCAARARERHLPTVLDARGEAALHALRGAPTVFKVTCEELHATVRAIEPDRASPQADVAALCATLRDYGARHVVITDGPDPVLVVDEEGKMWEMPVPPIDLRNSIGSGDAMSAGILLGLSTGESLEDAVARGVRFGCANARTVHPGELDMDWLRGEG